MHVVGVDASELLLDVARATGTIVDYHLGDLRDLPVDALSTPRSLGSPLSGYFDDDGNRTVLAEYRRALHPEGRLLMEMHNRDDLVRRFTPAPFSHTVQIGDDLRIDTSEFDSVEGRMETDRLVVRDGQVRRSHQSVRVPTITELRGWLAGAGFSSTRFTARNGQAPSIHHPRLIVVAIA